LQEGGKACASRIKAESGKLFCFSIFAWRGKRNRRTKQEQRLLADYALQEGGKACASRIKAESGKLFSILVFSFQFSVFRLFGRGFCCMVSKKYIILKQLIANG